MKKSLLALALAAALPGVANAQTSVTLYGLIDAGIVYNSNIDGNSKWSAGNGLINGSRFGLKGSEDLGGGMKAVFTLENGFDIGNGRSQQDGRMFGRQAFVGLASNTAGTFTIGRQYDSLVDHLAPLSFTGGAGGGTIAAHPFDNDNLSNSMRVNNSVKYSSVDYGGVKFGATYGFSNKAGAFGDNRVASVGASYDNGPIRLAAAYLNVRGANTNENGAASGTPFSAGKQDTFGVGGQYAFGPATVGAVWTQTRLSDGVQIAGGAGSKAVLNNYEINARYLLTPALALSGAYTFTHGKFNNLLGDEMAKWHQVTLQADYYLSKRTDVYVSGAYQHAIGDGVTANISTYGASSNRNQTIVGTGLRHRF